MKIYQKLLSNNNSWIDFCKFTNIKKKDMKKINVITAIVSVLFISGLFIHAVSKSTLENKRHIGTPYYVPTEADFAGENTPLNIYDVRERFERELIVNANLHSSTIIILKRANRAFPIIEPILEKNGIPDDFKYLAVIESALVNATSPSGAKGYWQFMPTTAKEYKMEVNDIVDERYHLEKETEAACKYLLTAKEKFGSWTLAAASYNAGMAGIQNQLDTQKVTNYYDLLLGEETSRYVFRILALKDIMKNPKNYGFDLNPNDLYVNLPTKKLEIDSSITNLADFAKQQGINYKILKLHNPWLRDKKLVNTSRKKYVIEIPTEGY
jgi:membrane-bound lytic murein transglycosylase D